MYLDIKRRLRSLKNKEKAKVLQGFFKTGPGGYAEGDVFLGIPVPILRKIALEYKNSGLDGNLKLLRSDIHEERLLALLILSHQYKLAGEGRKKKIYNIYLENTRWINNWDLVDLSAPNIVGDFLLKKDKKILYRLAKSKFIWARRIAVVSTFCFIRNLKFKPTLKIAKILFEDEEDLIQKATGWMLREIGKRDRVLLESFLKNHYKRMPRIMLRYAIEKFSEKKRQGYLKSKI